MTEGTNRYGNALAFDALPPPEMAGSRMCAFHQYRHDNRAPFMAISVACVSPSRGKRQCDFSL